VHVAGSTDGGGIHGSAEYTALLTRAFNGAIEVDGQRIVAHPSGTLVARPKAGSTPAPAVVWQSSATSDQDNDWSDI
jgi:hypothetical protein